MNFIWSQLQILLGMKSEILWGGVYSCRMVASKQVPKFLPSLPKATIRKEQLPTLPCRGRAKPHPTEAHNKWSWGAC
jgi:hypothetical protein